MLLGIEPLPLLKSFAKNIKLQRYLEKASVKECRLRIDLLPEQNNNYIRFHVKSNVSSTFR